MGYSKLKSYEFFIFEMSDSIDIKLAENGADRELDFDRETEYQEHYDRYVEEWTKIDRKFGSMQRFIEIFGEMYLEEMIIRGESWEL
jgi:membrane glycosyltransferase